MSFAPISSGIHYPCNFSAEQEVIAALIKDTSLYMTANLVAKDFYDPRNRAVFAAVRDLSDRRDSVTAADIISVLSSNKKIAEAGGEPYVASLCDQRARDLFLNDSIRDIQNRRTRRSAIAFGLDLIATASADTSNESLIGFFNAGQGKVFTETASGDTPAGERAYDTFMQRVKAYGEGGQTVDSIKFGLAPLDRFFNDQVSVKPTYMVLGATPSTGKTALVGQFFWSLIRDGHKVFFASQEMSAEEIIDRIVANVSGKSLSHINTGRFVGAEIEEMRRHYEMVRSVIDQNAEIYDDPNMSVETITAKAMAFKRKHGSLTAILGDYLQAIDCEAKRNAAEHEKIAATSRAFKGLAKTLKTICVILSQITLENGALEPEMRHLRGSKQIAQDADIVLLLSVAASMRATEGHDIIKIQIAKGRSIGTGIVHAKFTPRLMRFEEATSFVPPQNAISHAQWSEM